MSNIKELWWYYLNLADIVKNPAAGAVYYLDGTSGLDTNNGLTPDTPFLTVTYALTQMAEGANDYLIVLGYPNAAVGETWPIDINKSKVHIIGTPSQASPSPSFFPDEDAHCFIISASNVEIAGLQLSGAATKAAIVTSGTIWKANIHHNFFNWMQTAQDAIQLSNETDLADCPQWWIHDNKFGSNFTQHGIHIIYNSCRTIIERNLFLDIPSGGIGVFVDQAGAAVGAILDNTFAVADAADGEAITFIAGTALCTIHGNRTGEGVAAMTQTPYRDLGANNWGMNWFDVRAIMPVAA